MSFSDLPSDCTLLMGLYTYWIAALLIGTCVTLYVSSRFLICLPKWTHLDLEGEIEPPAPYETAMALTNMVSTGDAVVQPFVSPAILQANETGTLVLTRDAAGKQKYLRTRKVTASGFEPIMGFIEMERERELLLDWVGKHAPRRRHRTLSVPGIDFRYGAGFGTGNIGVYGVEQRSSSFSHRNSGRPRSSTQSPQVRNETTGP